MPLQFDAAPSWSHRAGIVRVDRRHARAEDLKSSRRKRRVMNRVDYVPTYGPNPLPISVWAEFGRAMPDSNCGLAYIAEKDPLPWIRNHLCRHTWRTGDGQIWAWDCYSYTNYL